MSLSCQGLAPAFVLPITIESNNLFGLMLYKIHEAKVYRVSIQSSSAQLWEHVAISPLELKKIKFLYSVADFRKLSFLQPNLD